jgi:tetratricopeptide (TPR) repeat protein
VTARSLTAVLSAAALVALALGLAACAGCGAEGGGAAVGPAASGACPCATSVVDPALLAFLSKAKAVHHRADLEERAGRTAEAIAALRELVDGPAPGGGSPPPEAREVIADTLARIGELASARGDFDVAKRAVERGLALAVERTHFRGRLMEVLGVVEERLHDRLRGQGPERAAEAAAARDRALGAYEEAVAIQDEVIRKALREAGEK